MENRLNDILADGGIERIAATPEGMAAQKFAEKNERALRAAAENGDEKAMKELLQGFLKTPEGSKLTSELIKLVKK